MESALHYLMRSASVVSSGTQKGPRPGFLIDVIRCLPPRYWLKHKRETGELFEALKDSCTRIVSSPEVVNRHFDVERILETCKFCQQIRPMSQSPCPFVSPSARLPGWSFALILSKLFTIRQQYFPSEVTLIAKRKTNLYRIFESCN